MRSAAARVVLPTRSSRSSCARQRLPVPRRCEGVRASSLLARPVALAAAAADAAKAGVMDWTGHDLSGYLQRIREVNNTQGERSKFTQFFVGDALVGYMKPEFADLLREFPSVFEHSPDKRVTLSSKLAGFDQRTKAVAECMQKLKENGKIPGWRGELFPVTQAYDDEPFFLIERAAVSWFGLKARRALRGKIALTCLHSSACYAYGVHVNCYVERPDGSIDLWVARRSKTKSMWPGMLDHMVAGGLPHGISPLDNVKKECEEEANVSAELAAGAVATGAVSYESEIPEGLKRDVLLCFDLKVPPDFVPSNNDGEVEEFFLWPLAKVAEVVRTTTEYKPNCCLVIIDFLVRRGFVTPGKGFLDMLRLLRAGELS